MLLEKDYILHAKKIVDQEFQRKPNECEAGLHYERERIEGLKSHKNHGDMAKYEYRCIGHQS